MRLCLIVAAIVATLGIVSAETEDPTVYGKGVELGDTVTVADLLLRPEAYVDQVVRVEGVITGVDPTAGAWIDISPPRETRTLRFEVVDGEIVFPPEAKGRRVVAEGTFRKREPTADRPSVTFVIEGTGAVVH
jgi:hypothetical protein